MTAPASVTSPGPFSPPVRPLIRRAEGIPRWGILAILIGLEAAGALVLNLNPNLAIVHAGFLGLFGLYGLAKRNFALLVGVMAYLPGAEMLWRQSHATLYYLTAPYLVIFLSGVATIGIIGRVGRSGRMALVYIGLLLPAILVTVKTTGSGSRALVAFALAGPIALGLLITFTSQLRVQRDMYIRLLWIVVVSSVGPLTIGIYSLRAGLSTVQFTEQSNFVASGGSAPVQVSALLGLAVLASVLLIFYERDSMARILAVVAGIAFMVQCFLTFSRGGMTSVVIALVVLAVLQARNRQLRNRILFVSGVTLVLCFTVVFPKLDSATKGAFNKRFTSSETGRTYLASDDLKIFERNPLFGVGPGMTKFQRLGYDVCVLRSDGCANEGSSHTEWTRMLSEHGVAGAIDIVVLLMLFLRAYRDSDKTSRPFTVTMLAWGIAQMFYANFRIVAVPFALGLAFVKVYDPAPIPQVVEETAPAATAPPWREEWRSGPSSDTPTRGIAINGAGINGAPINGAGINGAPINGPGLNGSNGLNGFPRL